MVRLGLAMGSGREYQSIVYTAVHTWAMVSCLARDIPSTPPVSTVKSQNLTSLSADAEAKPLCKINQKNKQKLTGCKDGWRNIAGGALCGDRWLH